MSDEEIARVNKENLTIFNDAFIQVRGAGYNATGHLHQIAASIALMTVITENFKSVCRALYK